MPKFNSYSTVYISLLGTIYFNLIITCSVHVQTVYLVYFKRLTIINILLRIKTDSLLFFLLCMVLLKVKVL